MTVNKFPITLKDHDMVDLVKRSDHKVLAGWAIECAKRVLPFFENKFPTDDRPRTALNTLQTWMETGEFSMAVIRKASLDSHSAARAVGEDSSARSAARACGQAVATAHVLMHAMGAAVYAQQAVFCHTGSSEAHKAAAEERGWQYQRLLHLVNT